jgi:hypothetical protein
MKKFRFVLSLSAILIVVAASAFTIIPTAPRTDDPMLHWFDASGNYLGYRQLSTQEADCPGTGAVCANGYAQIDEEEQPVGDITSVTQKQP